MTNGAREQSPKEGNTERLQDGVNIIESKEYAANKNESQCLDETVAKGLLVFAWYVFLEEVVEGRGKRGDVHGRLHF